MTKPTYDSVIAAYIKLRDKKKEITDRQKEELKGINEQMESIEGWLHREMLEHEMNSIKTDAGTAFTQTVSSVKIKDWDAALAYVQEHELYHMLERRLAKASVEEFVEGHDSDFPGTQLSKTQVVRFRR